MAISRTAPCQRSRKYCLFRRRNDSFRPYGKARRRHGYSPTVYERRRNHPKPAPSKPAERVSDFRKAKEIGVKQLAMPTNGNAGAAWALYAARSGVKATIVMPLDAPEITRREVVVSGADLHLVNG